jgi:tetratricopeptide (TPR) repeat protein
MEGSIMIRPSRRNLVLFVLAAALILGLCAWLWQRGRTPEPPLVDLDGIEPEVAQAIRHEMDSVRRQGRSGQAWGRLGQMLRAHGFDAEAVACWRHAERFDDQEPRWPYYRGVVLLMQGDNVGLDSLRRAAGLADRVDPGNPDPRLTLAEQLLAHAEDSEAAQVLKLVAQKHPKNARLLFSQAVLAERSGEVRQAIGLFARLTKHPCARQRASARLAVLHAQLGGAERAASYAQMSAQLPEDARWPDHYWAELSSLDVGRQARFRELSRRQNEENDEAVHAHLLHMTEGEDAGYGKAHLALGTTQFSMGQYQQAEQSLRKALALEPKSVRTLRILALVLLRQAEEQNKATADARHSAELREESIALLRRAIALKPNDAAAHLILGSALREAGRRKEALEALRVPVATQPDEFRNYLPLIDALIDAGLLAEARTHLHRAARLAPSDNPEIAQARLRLAEKEKSSGHKIVTPRTPRPRRIRGPKRARSGEKPTPRRPSAPTRTPGTSPAGPGRPAACSACRSCMAPG